MAMNVSPRFCRLRRGADNAGLVGILLYGEPRSKAYSKTYSKTCSPTLRNTTNCAEWSFPLWPLGHADARRQPCAAINLAQRNMSAAQYDSTARQTRLLAQTRCNIGVRNIARSLDAN